MLSLLRSSWTPLRSRIRNGVEIRWASARNFTNRWYPQGIDVATAHGKEVVAVSWFRQDSARTHLASRITLIDLNRRRHLDIALAIPDADGSLRPAPIHAGGIAWFGKRLFVAATGAGIWEFDMHAAHRVYGTEARDVMGSRGRGRDVALVAVRTRVHEVGLRCSFIARTFDDNGRAQSRVLIGEYRRDQRGRISEFEIPGSPDGSFTRVDEFTPGIAEMQGAARLGDQYFVSQSEGLHPGKLWAGSRDELEQTNVAMPTGCEDLALDPRAGLLWTLGEHPWQRIVRGIPLPRRPR